MNRKKKDRKNESLEELSRYAEGAYHRTAPFWAYGGKSLAGMAMDSYTALPRGRFIDIPRDFSRSLKSGLVNSINHAKEQCLDMPEEERAYDPSNRIKSGNTKLGVIGSTLGYTTAFLLNLGVRLIRVFAS